MIRVENIYKRFNDKHVLRGVNLAVQDGETLVVLGKSGVGKSVLLRLILRLMEADQGRIIIDDKDIATLTPKEMNKIRLKFGMLFQSSALFDSMNVEDNVSIALRTLTEKPENEIHQRVADCLKMVDLDGTEALFPAELSGGMRKRVGLARAVAMNPAYLLYDEPTTGLDPVMTESIAQIIRKLQRELNVTSIVVTHDLQTAFTVADKMALLHEGQIQIEGSIEALRDSNDPIVKEFIRGYARKHKEEVHHIDD
ncbi:MAG: ABC transporter ATP-binding protein [Lentisphaeria bacterium]|nr:ABC transporter ATP-binding protein [Candidatus Neomarinimicrobiota bacterium]MCF7842865.1 ABC transporter ATP-binding protein [Lentisphaeria bacterium]